MINYDVFSFSILSVLRNSTQLDAHRRWHSCDHKQLAVAGDAVTVWKPILWRIISGSILGNHSSSLRSMGIAK